MIRSLAAAFCLLALPAAAFDMTAMSAEEREAFRSEIRDYLLENPEVLMEAIGVLEAREAESQALADARMVSANAEAIFDDGFSWVGGNPEGDVTIVEFLDYRCGYCRRAHPVIGELLEMDGNIRLIVKEFPILGEESLLASRFALAVKAAHGDAAYKRAHDALMTMRANVTEASLTGLADDEGWDGAALIAAMNDPEITEIIQTNRALGQTLGISGTPSFVVGEQLLRGFLPLEGMQEIVGAAREG